MIAAIVMLALQTAQQIQASRSGLGNFRDFLTNPRDGIQTQAGQALAEIIRQYEEIKTAGQNSPETITTVINSIEQVRAAFEKKVREFMGGIVYANGGAAGIVTINGVAAKLVADRQAEMAQLTARAGAVAGAGGAVVASLGNNLFLVLVIIAIGFLILSHLRGRR